MLKYFLVILFVCVGGLSLYSKAEVKAVGPAKKELKIYEYFIGKWKAENSIKPCGLYPKGVKNLKDEYECKWILDGQFVEINGKALEPDGSTKKYKAILGYDPLKKVYVSNYFFSNGGRSKQTNKWDENSKKFTMKTDMGNGDYFEYVVDMSDPKNVKGVGKGYYEGKVIYELTSVGKKVE